jgi:hypothetical protein
MEQKKFGRRDKRTMDPATTPASPELTPHHGSTVQPLLLLDVSQARFDLKQWLLRETGRIAPHAEGESMTTRDAPVVNS